MARHHFFADENNMLGERERESLESPLFLLISNDNYVWSSTCQEEHDKTASATWSLFMLEESHRRHDLEPRQLLGPASGYTCTSGA